MAHALLRGCSKPDRPGHPCRRYRPFVSSTALDIHEPFNSIRDVNELNKELEEPTVSEPDVCGIKLPIVSELQKMMPVF